MSEFKPQIGDAVRLRGGGPTMTVEAAKRLSKASPMIAWLRAQ